MTTSDVMTCFDCEGFGKFRYLGRSQVVVCRRCQGSGRCPSVMEEWAAAGELLRQERIARGVGLREQAKALGNTAAALSDIERGMVDPNLKNAPDQPR